MYVADLFRLKIFTLLRLVRLIIHVLRQGIQLTNVIHMGEDRNVAAVKHRDQNVSYGQLLRHVASVSGYVFKSHRVKQGSTVLLIADNSIPSIILLLALSALGCNIYIIGPMKDYDQFRRTAAPSDFDFVFSAIEEKSDYYDVAPIHYLTPVWEEALGHKAYRPFVKVRTTLSIFTSGSTGVARKAKRSNTLWQYLRAITDVVKTVGLQRYRTVLLPVPIYHSYGLSALFLGLMLNKTLIIVSRFDPIAVGKEIDVNKIEVAILIPQMIHRLLGVAMPAPRCIISCADLLPVAVLQAAREKWGDITYNFYGTSETGLTTIATPEMLAIRPDTIGRPITGCELSIVEEAGSPVLYVESGFAMRRGSIRTGDTATIDERGWYYLRGRADHLIVVNGVNAYPNDLLQMVYKNQAIQHAAIRTFTNEHGFKRIKLLLHTKHGSALDEKQFKDWWVQQYGATFFPSAIEFDTDGQGIKLM